MIEKNHLKRIISPYVILLISIMSIITIFCISDALIHDGISNRHGRWGSNAFILLILWPLVGIKIMLDRAYRISYDDEAVYQQFGFAGWLRLKPEQVMRYEDIETIWGDPGKILNLGIMPFEFIRLIRKNWDGEELFMLHPFYLRKKDIENLLCFIYEKRPDAYHENVIRYLKICNS